MLMLKGGSSKIVFELIFLMVVREDKVVFEVMVGMDIDFLDNEEFLVVRLKVKEEVRLLRKSVIGRKVWRVKKMKWEKDDKGYFGKWYFFFKYE